MSEAFLRTGLVSITFRDLPADVVLSEVTLAGLQAIEWGGDVHAPHGDVSTARRLGEATRDAGLALPTYGSYLRAGVSGADQPKVADVLDSAAALGVDAVRVWAGNMGSQAAPPEHRVAVTRALRDACDRAADQGLGITLEFHAGTLTDTPDSALALLADVNRPNLTSLWQTTNGAGDAHSLETLRRMQPHVLHAHVFQWDRGRADQRLLRDGQDRWSGFLRELRAGAEASGRPRFCLLEFVQGGSVKSFRRDAATLKSWLAEPS